MQLNKRAFELIKKYSVKLAESHGVDQVTKLFSISEPMEMKLRNSLLESVDFLQMITTLDVDQIKGQVVSVGNPGLFTGRVKDGRFGKNLGVDGNTYELVETDSCARLTWAMLSVWANSGSEGEFFQRINAFINQTFALDMLRIGFNGTHINTDKTDPDAYPNGEDVNKGWHQIARDWEGGRQVITDSVSLGINGDYQSLDAMASDLINTCIPQQFRNDPRLTVLVGADLVAAEQNRLYQGADKPTEKIAAQMLADSIAGRRAIIPPFIPGKRLAVTMLSNLHIYTQRNTRKRKAEDVEDRKTFENKYWRMEGYALETPDLYAAYDESTVQIKELSSQSEQLNQFKVQAEELAKLKKQVEELLAKGGE